MHIHAGLFPGTSGPIENLRFSFAHFDVDLYRATPDCLNFFSPRMLPGGILLSHDHSVLADVRQAFDEFLEGKPEDTIELPTRRCMLIKRRPTVTYGRLASGPAQQEAGLHSDCEDVSARAEAAPSANASCPSGRAARRCG